MLLLFEVKRETVDTKNPKIRTMNNPIITFEIFCLKLNLICFFFELRFGLRLIAKFIHSIEIDLKGYLFQNYEI